MLAKVKGKASGGQGCDADFVKLLNAAGLLAVDGLKNRLLDRSITSIAACSRMTAVDIAAVVGAASGGFHTNMTMVVQDSINSFNQLQAAGGERP